MKKGFPVFTVLIYSTLAAASLWQGLLLFRQFQPGHRRRTAYEMIDVRVEGNVRRPGLYRVARGTTRFEILKVAGVRPTSDLSLFNLTAQVDSADELNVGSLDAPVKVKEKEFSARLEFFFGEISIVGSDGRSVPQHEGLVLQPGNRVLTEASSQAELSVGSYSRIDMDNFSELIFDKLGTGEDGRAVVEVFQKAGACWYKTVYTKNTELFRITTQPVVISVGGSGADFLVDVQPDRTVVNLMDGLLLVERTTGGEAINMISGQSATIFNDERPFQVTKLTPDVSVNERFAQLSREKVNYLSRQMPLNILFCGTPSVFYFFNINFEAGVANIIHLPGELLIEQFANGIRTLDQAFLYGGPVMVATFVERILDTRIPKYIVFDKSDVLKIGNSLGGLEAEVDQHAASILKIGQGRQKLSDQALLYFLSPVISGVRDAQRRQSEVLKNIFNNLKSKRLVPTILLSDQIISTTETNFGATEIMNHYSKFSERSNWKYQEFTIPVTSVKRDNRTCLDPDLKKSKKLLSTNE
jgi:anionic cell wall polymer biosynthesis LytR-Cps2A-Psr (LCP) family protein